MNLSTPPDDRYCGTKCDWWRFPVRLFSAMIMDGHHFALSSYGDGEWKCILGYEGKTARGQEYNPWLREALTETLLHPVGQWCTYWGNPRHKSDGHKKLRAESDAWLAEHQPDVTWFSRRAVDAANCNGGLGSFLSALRTKRVILVGPEHFKRMDPRTVGDFVHVQVPSETAWKVVDETCAKLARLIQGGEVVLFSSGMAAPVAIHKLWPEMKNDITLIDVGAIFDPYCGVYSRRAYRQPDFADVVEKTLEESWTY